MHFATTALISVLATGSLVVSAAKIHGHDVSDDCVAAYKAALAPEKTRTEKYVALAGLVKEPPELKERITKASEALQKYQAALQKADTDLEAPIPDADKTALKAAQVDTADVAPALAAAAASSDDAVKAAFAEFLTARKAETAATQEVEAKCPKGLDLEG